MKDCKFKSIRFSKFNFDFSSIPSQIHVKGILDTRATYPNDRKSFIVIFDYQMIDAKMPSKEYLSYSSNILFEMTNDSVFDPDLFDDEVVGEAFTKLKNAVTSITNSFGISEIPLPASVEAPTFR